MIRVVAPEAPLREVVLFEIQGKVLIPQNVLNEARQRQIEKRSNTKQIGPCEAVQHLSGGKRMRDDSDEGSVTHNHCEMGEEDCGPLELSFGRVVADQINSSRCSLHIGRIAVDGSHGRYKEPRLVLRRCQAADSPTTGVAEVEGGRRSSVEVPSRTEQEVCIEKPCLLQEWLSRHPEELLLSTAVETATCSSKVYELVGIVEHYVHLNSKPQRKPL
ncbi:putative Ctf8 [Trypanosoma vivax]|uniref:Uncharacterized protein n=1 Tax=Trypanosoma vivax (strain Y486) TaxID=1055687 RepID=G0TZ04_TRYVY|nr:hypothetical protein TRVL_00144 [Trypanosoma vivax]KAH8613094.1 putative Ctf8 [Trypanosoma vivax]CCC49207.1 conserved hypothetical protein [Trypanosoma vivax Y486]